MSPDVKKYAVIGGAVVVAVVVGVIAYKHFENTGAASQGAAAQSQQDTLAYEQEMLAAGSGQTFSGSGAPQMTVGSESSGQTLAQEITSLESIFNPQPTAAAAATPAAAAVSTPVSAATVTAVPAPVLPVSPNERRIAQAEAPIYSHEGVVVA